MELSNPDGGNKAHQAPNNTEYAFHPPSGYASNAFVVRSVSESSTTIDRIMVLPHVGDSPRGGITVGEHTGSTVVLVAISKANGGIHV